MSASDLRRERESPRPSKRLTEPSEHHKVGVKLDTLQTANAQRGQSVLMLQASELALNSRRGEAPAAS
jgi:hypothetical protein